jgi:hypothetical protein
MKDFKKMPKMACGGGVKKYEDGGGVLADYKTAIKSGNIVDRMPTSRRNDGTNPTASRAVGAPEDTKYEGRMRMPEPSGTVNIPGVGKMQRAPVQTSENSILLKKGGKTKRGNKKK